MSTVTKDKLVSLRLTGREKAELEATAVLCGCQPAPLAATYVREGVRRSRFPVVEFRDGTPGRVAYLTGTRWPIWMVVELVKELDGDCAAAARHMKRPEPLVRMALAYADAYPEEIAASLKLHASRDFAAMQQIVPGLVKL